MKTIVIIPTFNERDNLVPLVWAVLASDPDLDILVVDDNSPDGTGELADALASETPHVRVLHRTGKQGLGTAYVAGFRYALASGYERVVEMDADFSHRPEDLPRLLAAAATADVVVGSRNVPGGQVIGWSPLRQLISKGGSFYARLLLGLPIRDCTSGFKCFRRTALEAIDVGNIHSNGYAFQVEVNHACLRAGLRFAEVPITFPDRARGSSKMSWRIVVEAALLVLGLRTTSQQRTPSRDLPTGCAQMDVPESVVGTCPRPKYGLRVAEPGTGVRYQVRRLFLNSRPIAQPSR
jgi:dolichol-phosphate mannosyltransferase